MERRRKEKEAWSAREEDFPSSLHPLPCFSLSPQSDSHAPQNLTFSGGFWYSGATGKRDATSSHP
jgi:hypothetical protein